MSRRASIPIEEDPKKKWKNLHENYDDHHNRKLFSHVHRGDLASTNRLLGYNDAMMATCATFLVVPIKHSKMKKAEELGQFLESIKVEVLMFFIGFFLVATIWESTNIRCIVVKRLDDLLVLLSIVQMLITAFLPFSIALQGNFPGNSITVLSTSIILVLVELVEVIIIVYAFASPRLLHIEMKAWRKKEVRPIRNALLKKSLINLVFITIGALFEFYDYRVSWAFFSLLILNPLFRKIYLFIQRRKVPPDSEHSHFYWFLMKGNISKERVEAFTDALTAIIACLMILDIVIEQFKMLDEISAAHLWDELKETYGAFVTFVVTYIGVSLLWYVNHTIFHLFHTVNTVLLYLQKLFLFFLSLAPLCGSTVSDFSGKQNTHGDAKMAIRIGSILTFVASLCNVLMLAWGYSKKHQLLHSWAMRVSKERNRKKKIYIELKTIIMPFWSIVAFIGSFGSLKVATIIALVSCGFMCVSFILLKLIFVNHIGKQEKTNDFQMTATNNKKHENTTVDENSRPEKETNEVAVRCEPSDATIARLGGAEFTDHEIMIEKLRNAEFDGNEVNAGDCSDCSSEDDESDDESSIAKNSSDDHKQSFGNNNALE